MPDDPELSSVHDVFELADAGNTAARSVVDHVASRLGTAIATVCAILDPELVVLGGGIGASPLLLRPVRGSAAALVPITARIETSLLGERAALQGAIAVALHAARTTLLLRARRRRRSGIGCRRAGRAPAGTALEVAVRTRIGKGSPI